MFGYPETPGYKHSCHQDMARHQVADRSVAANMLNKQLRIGCPLVLFVLLGVYAALFLVVDQRFGTPCRSNHQSINDNQLLDLLHPDNGTNKPSRNFD